jgi:hypothetical protein
LDWTRRFQADIRDLHCAKIEALHDKFLAVYEHDLSTLVTVHQKIQAELATRPFKALNSDVLLKLSLLLRTEIRSIRADLACFALWPPPQHLSHCALPQTDPDLAQL